MLYNTLGLRFIALFFIDGLIMLPLALLEKQEQQPKLDMVFIATIILGHAYYIIGHAQYGRTFRGKKLMGLKVVSAHQHLPITWLQAILRELLWMLRSAALMLLIANPGNSLNTPHQHSFDIINSSSC